MDEHRRKMVKAIGEIAATWPEGVLDAAGAAPDFASLEDIRKGYGTDAVRDTLE
jgi:hypothetical protein